MQNANFGFGPFTLIPSERLLLRDGEPVKVGSHALDILVVSRAGEVASKGDLIPIVRPRTFIEEADLRVDVAGLRRALGDGREPHRFNTGRGCFMSPVDGIDRSASLSLSPTAMRT